MGTSVETSAVDLPQIEKYWEDASKNLVSEDRLRATARDPYLQQVVETAIEKWIWPSAKVLDIGCGDGTSTLRFSKRASFVHGVDFIPRYVDAAREAAQKEGARNVDFAQANVMDLSDTRRRVSHVDIAITIRCLINLATWENQTIALKEIAATLHPGGLYLLSEGWSDGWDGLNQLRIRCGIGPIELVKYNCLMNRTQFEKGIGRDFEVLHYENLGFYIFMSRVFQPAFVAPESPKHLHDINRIAAALGALGIGANEFRQADYAGVYVLRKK